MLSAILWIGNLEFTDTESEACQLTQADLQVVRKIGKLLGLPEAQVRKVCTIRQINVKGTTTDIALKFHEVRGGVGTNKLCIVHNPMYCIYLTGMVYSLGTGEPPCNGEGSLLPHIHLAGQPDQLLHQPRL